MLSPGTMVGPYRVAEHVGAEGTMAEVYRAVDPGGRTVAVKLLGELREQAMVEAAAVAGLDHPGIVRTYEVLERDGRLCLIQEWVDGQTLEAILHQFGRLGLDETVWLGREVASALAYAHERNILHRDLKPSNVLRTTSGAYKLVDFGAAGLLDPGTETTRAGEIAGTPLYMSPEQAVGAPQSAASDVYGLGLLLYRSLYGKVPGEEADHFIELLASRIQKPIVVPPSPLQGLLERCLAIDPVRRPQSAREVFEELVLLGSLMPVRPTGAPAQPVTAHGQQTPVTGDPVPWAGDPGDGGFVGRDVVIGRADARLPTRAAGGLRALTAVVVTGAAALLAWLLAPDVADAGFWLRVSAGLAIVGVALVVARRVRRLASRAPRPNGRRRASSPGPAGGRR